MSTYTYTVTFTYSETHTAKDHEEAIEKFRDNLDWSDFDYGEYVAEERPSKEDNA